MAAVVWHAGPNTVWGVSAERDADARWGRPMRDVAEWPFLT